MSYETRLFIGSEYVHASDGATFDTINPANEEVLASVSAAQLADVNRAVDVAWEGFRAWSAMTASERGVVLQRMAEVIEANGDELAGLDSVDAGKPIADCKEDVHAAVNMFRYFAGAADKAIGHTLPVQNEKFCYTRREPYGVIAAITAWNYPLFNACAKIAPILATGNSCILKPAEEAPLTSIHLAGLLGAVEGAPPGLVNVLPGIGEVTGAALAQHDRIHKLSFTGGTDTGRIIMAAAAESNLKSLTLELGGKGPVLAFEDANLESLLNAVTFSVFYNQGQTCTAGTRLLVDRAILEQVESGLLERAKRIVVGPPSSEDTLVGALVSRAQYDKVVGFIESAKRGGARLVYGGARPEGVGVRGFYLLPTIFADVLPDSELFQQEIFGPVLAITPFDTEDEAVALANDTRYGLAASIWTKDMSRFHRLAGQVQSGIIWGNTAFSEHPGAPAGGYRQSGFGREYGLSAIDEYTQLKTVWLDLSDDFFAWA